ncbi:MAG: bifunctional [glutamine synthetase] adenylyltransferase/[glutamine synthetase]-adenylyl-L-tyrosine phosphorylase [Pseudomonadota bacterium]
MTDQTASLSAILGASPHLSDLAIKVQGTTDAASVVPEPVADAMAAAKTEFANVDLCDETGQMAALRKAKQRVLLAIALSDLLGHADLDATVEALSDFADLATDQAVRVAIALEGSGGKWIGDTGASTGYTVIGMGKLGAHELNYSSDIDIIVLFEPDALDAATSDRVEPATFAVRVTRRLVRLLQERTADGYVFRTDLRLRPDPGSTPVALSIHGALNYYEGQGRTWERAAMIKARCIAGDKGLGATFLKAIEPFIWRKHLDYAAIDSIRSIKRRINTHKGFGEITVPGHDVKLGRGGIREIEFFGQTQQLIAGGRNRDLRVQQTKAALRGLAHHGWIEPGDAESLIAAYDHLRRIEHCIQMIRDEQTHRLPQAAEERMRVAVLMGENLDMFDARAAETFQAVHTQFLDLFAEETVDGAPDPYQQSLDDTLRAHLEGLGFEEPEVAHRLLRSWIQGRMNCTLTNTARDRLRAITPDILRIFGQTDRPDTALRLLDTFLRGLPAGVQFFSMLESNPRVIELLARIMGTAPKLANILALKPRLFDALLDPRFFGSLPSSEAIRADLARVIDEAPTYEAKLNAGRIVGQEQHFLIGVRLLSQTLTADEAANAYTDLAEEVVLAMLDVALADIEKDHGKFAGASLTVLGMGKLGSRELTAASDLDLLLIYDIPEGQSESDGQRPAAPAQYYTRVTQRLIAALSAPTSEGKLYELDMRLRPSGNAGPLATSLTAFERYQMNSARTWEHMALTRARPFGRSPEGCGRLTDAIARVLMAERDEAQVVKNLVDMRALIEREKPPVSVFDTKLARGGIIDVEFIAQGLQLVHARSARSVLQVSTAGALSALQYADFLSADDSETLCAAHRLYASLSQITRLCLDGVFDPDTAAPSLRRLVLQAADLPSMETLITHLEHTQRDVRDRFVRLFAAVAEPHSDQVLPRSSLGGDLLEGETS